jgi:putative cell wall-binding protein
VPATSTDDAATMTQESMRTSRRRRAEAYHLGGTCWTDPATGCLSVSALDLPTRLVRTTRSRRDSSPFPARCAQEKGNARQIPDVPAHMLLPAPVRRALVGLTLVATSTALVAAPTAPAQAATTTRVAGEDRYATAVAVSRSTFSPGVPVAFVVTGVDFPDALAAGPSAAAGHGPVLLVATDQIPAPTAEELGRLQPQRIVVVGGPRSVSDAVARELERYTDAEVRRVAGSDRHATAAALSAATFPTAGTVLVAGGAAFPDALAATPAAHRNGSPLLLVSRSDVPAATAGEIRRLGARRIVILGGTATVDAQAESELRRLAPDVVRWAGADRSATSVAVSARTFAAGVPAAYLATGASYADALAGGPVAALAGAPVLLVRGNCVPVAVRDELRRLAPQRVVLLGGAAALGPGVEEGTLCPWAGAPQRTPEVTPASSPAWNDDAPDPHVVRFGNRWYAYTTGTTWGNNLGVLVSDRPDGGWTTTTGKPYGSTALSGVPSWQRVGTQWAPGVFAYGGRYVMFYAAQARAHEDWCLSVATAGTPAGPFVDRSSGPLLCQRELGGAIDPQPFLDADGRAWLHWKNNDGFGSKAVSKVWAAPLTRDGVSLAAPPREVLAKDTTRYPWQTTVDNPQMLLVDGRHYLFHTGGDYVGNDSYAAGYATCAGPAGPCTTASEPLLRSYGAVAGPGGGTVARDAAGRWWMSYHAWTSGCTSYSCGGKRKLYVAPLTFR